MINLIESKVNYKVGIDTGPIFENRYVIFSKNFNILQLINQDFIEINSLSCRVLSRNFQMNVLEIKEYD